MAGAGPEQTVVLQVFAVAFALLLLADFVLVAVMVAGWARGRSLLARRWSAAHVLIGFQAWLLPTFLVTALAAAVGVALSPGASSTVLTEGPWLKPVMIAGVVTQNLAMIVVVLGAVHFLYDQHLTAAGLSLRRWPQRAALGLLAGLVVIPANVALERLSALVVRQAPLPTLWQRGFETQMKQFLGLFSGTEGLLLAILLIGIIAPLGEEIFFRGFAYRCFRTRWGPAVGAAASAGLFALVHLHPVGLLPIFVVGCALAYLYERTGSLVAPFTLHAVNNIAALLVLHFSRGA